MTHGDEDRWGRGRRRGGRTAEEVYPRIYRELFSTCRCLLLLHHFERLVEDRLARESGVYYLYYPFRYGELSP